MVVVEKLQGLQFALLNLYLPFELLLAFFMLRDNASQSIALVHSFLEALVQLVNVLFNLIKF